MIVSHLESEKALVLIIDLNGRADRLAVAVHTLEHASGPTRWVIIVQVSVE